MAETITQRLGFEAGNAISTINSMATALGGLNTKIRAFNKAASAGDQSKVIQGFAATGAAASKAGAKVDAAGKKLQTFGKEGKDGVQKVSFAWQGLAKALVARTMVQAITNLTGAISRSADAAADFEIAVARISNIATGAGSSIDELTNNLASMAVEMGRAQDEVSGAAFEALQNDLGTTAETMDLLSGAAHNLALVTGGTLEQSVNSLSSVLKAYDLDISKADEVSDQFFAAIDKGRITLAELENSLGKITPLAAKLNIEFGQVAGAMAAITQSGTSASVANTQLRSIMQKLIRPTKELDVAFRVLGVKTFKDLQERSGGLRQSLQAIAGALGNDERAIAKAFGRLRGQLGVFNLLANGGKIFAETMDAVANSAGKAAAGADKIDGTAARESQKAWAAFDETMRQVGETVLVLKTRFIQTFNALIPSGATLVGITKFVVALTASLATMALVAKGVAVAMAAIALGVVPLAPLMVAAAAAGVALAMGLDALTVTYQEKLDEIETKAVESKKKLAEETKKAGEEGNKIIDDILATRSATNQAYINGMEKAFDRETAALTGAAATVGTALRTTIEDFASALDSTIEGMKTKLAGIKGALKSAVAEQKTARQELEDFKFDKEQRGKTALQVFNNEMDRAEKGARDLKKGMANALKNPEAVEAVKKDIARLLEQARALKSKAESFKNPVRKREAIEDAERLEEQALKANLKLADKKVANLKSQATATQIVLNKQKAITAELKFQLLILADQIDLLDKAGKAKAPETQVKDQKAALETNKRVMELFGELDGGLLKTFGKQEYVDAMIKNLKSGFDSATFDFSNIADDINAKIQEKDYKVFLDAVINFESSGDQKIDQVIRDKVEEAGGNIVSQSEAIRDARTAALREMTTKQGEYNATVKDTALLEKTANDQAAAAIEAKAGAVTIASAQLWSDYKAIFDQIMDPATSADQIGALEAQLNNLAGKINNMWDEEKLKAGFSTAMLEAIATAEKIIENKKLIIELEAKFDPTVMENLKNQIAESVGAGAQAADATVTAVGQINSGLLVTKSNADSAAISFSNMADQAERAARASQAAKVAAAYHGGKVAYRAAGGPTRGQDTQLTATSPGEFITNAKSSRQFFTELQAMNAGQSPQYRDKGGPVTNNSVGDIHINMPEGTSVSDPSLVRNIASDLRRELRRQTSTF